MNLSIRLYGFSLAILFAHFIIAQEESAILDFENPPKGYMVWKSDSGTHRVWTGEQYILVNDAGETLTELPQFKHVSDFSEGVALVKTKFDKCGYLNLDGKIVIHPKWTECRASSGGFVVVKDRYDDLFLVKTTGEQVPLPLSAITSIQGTAIAEDKQGKELYIDLSKVNFNYYHPLMKAIQKVDDMDVIAEVHQNEREIRYRKGESDEILYKLKITLKQSNK